MTSSNTLPDHIVSIFIEAPVERVWDEITKTDRTQKAVYNTVLEGQIKAGSRVRYYSPDKKRVFVVGEVLEVEAPRIFSHTYWFTMWKSGPPTKVTWELEEEQGGCRVTITHTGWTKDHEARDKTGAGWQEILALLKQEIETGTIPVKTRILYAVMGMFMFMMPKTTTKEYADKQGW